jgi:16S rRNA processing protein RimM
MAERLLVGVVVGAQGLGGVVRVKSFTANPADLAAYGPVEDDAGRTLALSVVGDAKGVVLARVAGVTDRTQAEALKGARFYVSRDALPAPSVDEFYLADLIGLMAEREDGTALGRVKAVHDFGAGEVIELEGPGATLMLPFTETVVPVVDLAGKRIVVVPPAVVGDEDEGAEEREDAEAEHARH